MRGAVISGWSGDKGAERVIRPRGGRGAIKAKGSQINNVSILSQKRLNQLKVLKMLKNA